MRRRTQSGQALVAALVTMALLFALAGALAIAASATLSQQRASTPPFQTDFKGQSAIAAIVAALSADPERCPAGSLGQNGEISGYSCSRLDLVTPLVSPNPSSALLSWKAGCGVAALPATGHVTAWVNVRGDGYRLYIDGSASGCGGGGGACAAPSGSPLLVIRDCDLSTVPTAYVHLSGPAGPSAVRYATAASFVPTPDSPMPVQGQVTALALGHFHVRNDGVWDLAVAQEKDGAATVNIYLGSGNGRFSATPCFRSQPLHGGRPIRLALAVADLDGDGTDDLAFTNPNSVSVYLASAGSDCSLSPAPGSPFALGDPCEPDSPCDAAGLVAARLRSGPLDLAVSAHATGQVLVLKNNGSGSFAPGGYYAVGGTPASITAAPLTGGAFSDVAVADPSGGQVMVLRSDGRGSFSSLTRIPVGASPTGIVTGQFDGSGRTGLAVSTSADWLAIIPSTGNGGFGAPLHVGGGPATALATGNLAGHRDGLADLVAAGPSSLFPRVAKGNGTFGTAVGGDLAGPRNALAVAVGTLTGDPQHQAVVVGGDGSISVFIHNRQQVFSVLVPYATGTATNSEADVFALNGPMIRLSYEGGL